ncbi:MAG: hypothetical protein WBO46_09830, partial [Caldilineaceae bacterium]
MRSIFPPFKIWLNRLTCLSPLVALLMVMGCAAALPVAQGSPAVVVPSEVISTPEPTTTPTAEPTAQPEPSPTADADLIAQGVQVYRSRYCGVCHTMTAANTRGTFAPNHDHVATNALAHLADPRYNGSAVTVADYLMESLLTPQLY